MRVSPTAPAPTAAAATATRSVTLGDNLAKTGKVGGTWSRTAPTAAAVASGWAANMCPRSSRFGQLTLTSTAVSRATAGARAAAALA